MDPIELPHASEQPQSRIEVRLSPQEHALHEALQEKSTELAEMYDGALAVLKTFHHPEKLPLAAHSVRELMEKVPEAFGIATIGKGIPKPDVSTLEKGWKAISRLKCDGSWPEKVNDTTAGFLNAVGEYLDRCREFKPKRKTQIGELMDALDASETSLPQPLAKLRVNEWDMIWDYFKSVAHHNRSTAEPEFRDWLRALEDFLLSRLRPRTFGDFDELDELIHVGESHA